MAGTAVLTTLGKKAIEDIRIGDKIPCVDHITGEESEKRVVATSVNKTDKLVELEIGGEIIRCTETHPFQVKDKGWVDAAELVPGDMVYRKNWQISPVQHVTLVTFDEPVAVYNFEVEDFHTYYIGDGCWLVHNACTQRSAKRKAKRSVNISKNQKPTSVERVYMVGENGRYYPADLEIYGNKFIRNDKYGHLFSDGQTIGRHYNSGIIDEIGRFIQTDNHFWY